MIDMKGISICLPLSGKNFDESEYQNLDFAQKTQWDEFLSETFKSRGRNEKNKSVNLPRFNLLEKFFDQHLLLFKLLDKLLNLN